MSYEDEVMPPPHSLRERRVNLYEGSAPINSTHEAWECRGESTQEEERLFAN